MDSEEKEVKLTIAEFFAFGLKNQRIYINQDIDYINTELQDICNTNELISLTTYSAKLVETHKLPTSNGGDSKSS